MGKYFLAMYDVRGKQAFIFRNNHIKEIVGGSCIIRDCFSEIRNRKDIYTSNGEDFSASAFKERMESGSFTGEVIYDGGGNFLVLYKDQASFTEVNKSFTKTILTKYNGLHVLCSGVEVDDSLSDYISDRKRLYNSHRKYEATDLSLRPVNTLPFVQVDPTTSIPITGRKMVSGNWVEVTTESNEKYSAYETEVNKHGNELGQKLLDQIIKQKGVNSLLAVVFIDGNNMGAQVQACLNGLTSYEECVNKLRVFSANIQKHYVDDPLKAIDTRLLELHPVSEEKAGEKSDKKLRQIVHAGDEMSFICQADDALSLVKAYFESLPDDCSSCAGIAIFHSHAPYHAAYKIAEQCCESGKKRMKERNETNACYIDFQICQSGIGMDLEDIRERETKELTSKPWKYVRDTILTEEDDIFTLNEIEEVAKGLSGAISRTNVKGLAAAAEASQADFDMEMARIYAHLPSEKKENPLVRKVFCHKDFTGKRRRYMVYDIVTIYDRWFRGTVSDGIDQEESDGE